ncbi:MAG: TonB-dependent receptor, partial [Flavobacterium sp.]|nr:TonB-dependent receptor [Flavobacterium sp.]
FVNVSSAFKTPSLFQLYSDFGNLDLKPEVSQSYEAGFQSIALKDKLKFGFTAFARDIKDVIEFALVDPANFTFQYINVDEQNDYGFEVELEAVPVKNLTAKAFYNYVDGKVNKSGNKSYNLFKRPRHNFLFNLGYQATNKLYVGSNFKNVGKREDLFFNNNTFNTERVKLDSYFTIDFYAEFKAAKQIKLFIDLKNITDENFVEVVGFTPRGFNFMSGISLQL